MKEDTKEASFSAGQGEGKGEREELIIEGEVEEAGEAEEEEEEGEEEEGSVVDGGQAQRIHGTIVTSVLPSLMATLTKKVTFLPTVRTASCLGTGNCFLPPAPRPTG